MQFKRIVVKLEDIDPSEIYFLPRSFTPVKIYGGKSRGWQRGWVYLDLKEERVPKYAFANPVSYPSNTILIEIQRFDSDFYFVESGLRPSLLSKQYVDFSKIKTNLQTELDKLIVDRKRLESKLNIFQNL